MSPLARLAFLFASVTAFAFEVNELIELTDFLNGRSYANFLKSTDNVQFVVPKGSVGKILETKRFHSGNFGYKIEIQNGEEAGKVAWVYHDLERPRLRLHEAPPAPDGAKADPEVSPADARYALALRDIAGIREKGIETSEIELKSAIACFQALDEAEGYEQPGESYPEGWAAVPATLARRGENGVAEKSVGAVLFSEKNAWFHDGVTPVGSGFLEFFGADVSSFTRKPEDGAEILSERTRGLLADALFQRIVSSADRVEGKREADPAMTTEESRELVQALASAGIGDPGTGEASDADPLAASPPEDAAPSEPAPIEWEKFRLALQVCEAVVEEGRVSGLAKLVREGLESTFQGAPVPDHAPRGEEAGTPGAAGVDIAPQ